MDKKHRKDGAGGERPAGPARVRKDGAKKTILPARGERVAEEGGDAAESRIFIDLDDAYGVPFSLH